jgi:uncharacterized protein YyaL (SSP411 family)
LISSTNKQPNSLINESSPYLLQHAYNPVHWLPFSPSAFEMAVRENKPLLISIGYSACHWCHVMEHESFEDEEVAGIMNENFICVKVDREERSDVDMLYMQAVQLMTGHGGWPLNCFVMPDGRPFYGGTYFSKPQWISVLKNLSDLYNRDEKKVSDYADELTKGIVKSEELVTVKEEAKQVSKELLKESVSRWKRQMDPVEGGPNRAPKFPLPSNYLFLLRYAILEKDDELLKFVELTLRKMAFGGIYDQLHGGFCRYSTDLLWKVPHFEKMLYDNSQLVSLYLEAYTFTKNELYLQIAKETLAFVEKEWLTKEGYFFSAYDADSEGVEGKYYVWNHVELQSILQDDFKLFAQYYCVEERGDWEHDNYIFMRNDDLAKILSENGLTSDELRVIIERCREKLRKAAGKRVKPGLDDKCLTSWNAMMCSAFARAYLVTGNEHYRKVANTNLDFIINTVSMNGELLRTYKNGKAKIGGFLDDYAFVIEACLNCYIVNKKEEHLRAAVELTQKALKIFSNDASPLLFYTSAGSEQLVARTTESQDNVIPSSNAQMAHNLFLLGSYFDRKDWTERAESMLSLVGEEIRNYGSAYSHWACLALMRVYPVKEVVIVGKNVDEKLRGLYNHGLTNAIFAVSESSSDLPLVKGRFVEGKTLIYVCENKSCQLPVTSVEEALHLLA